MITGIHAMFYSSEPDAFRAFLRDTLRFSHTDVGDGWLIFDMPDAEMGCHPADPGAGAAPGTHDISFYCDDIHSTVAELRGRGVEFAAEVSDQGYGLVTHFKLPGGCEAQLYQPRYKRNAAVKAKAAPPAKSKSKSKSKSMPKVKPKSPSKSKAKAKAKAKAKPKSKTGRRKR